jgi:ABC-type dipeptide/oligopeptide/nickel transport system permease subunit
LASFVAVGLTMWVEVARVVRGQVISVKEMQYVTAARALFWGLQDHFQSYFFTYCQ